MNAEKLCTIIRKQVEAGIASANAELEASGSSVRFGNLERMEVQVPQYFGETVRHRRLVV